MLKRSPRKARVLCGNCGCWYNAPEQEREHGIGKCGIMPGGRPDAKRTCNRHTDCDAADAKAKAEGRAFVDHCHDPCCEDCFGY